MFSRIVGAALLAVAVTITAGEADATTFVVGLADDCTPASQPLSEQIMSLFVGLQSGDMLAIYDAPRREILSTVMIPTDRPELARAAVRVRQFKLELAKLSTFLDARCAATRDSDESALKGNLIVPQLLADLSQTLIATAPRGTVNVLLVGSALYDDAREPQFSMRGGFYPSDAHLAAPAATSLYSVASHRGALSGVTVHWCYTDKDWVSDGYRDAVQRFWSLFVSGQGGKLGTFENDLSVCFRRFALGQTAGALAFAPDAPDSKIEMRHWTRPPIERTPVPPSEHAAPDGWLGTTATIVYDAPAVTRGKAKIGIRWTCNVDLDIYVRGSSTSPWIFFGHPRSPEGHLPRDIRQAPATGQIEYVEFEQVIDLKTAEAAVNFYEGTCSEAPRGVVRVLLNGDVYEAPFAIAATHGNRGGQPGGQMTGPYWTAIDLKKLLHLGL